nr:polyprenol phosphomannose-dependent alpha 1,6 mannosyltransferase MptB [Thermomonospora amylolytica]
MCFLLVALLGPSAMQPRLAGAGAPFSLDVGASPYVVIGLTAAGILLGTAGLGLCFVAVRRGWRCPAKGLMIAGVLAAAAFAVMPPVGSADHLNYAAYGRMAVTGHDPYATRAVDMPGDPVADAVEEWRSAPSVYGPIATAQQALASWAGGESVALTVFALSVTNALAFVLTGLILHRACRTPEGRLRAALLWTCNPLMLFHLVAGAHNDALAICAAVGVLAVLAHTSRPVLRTAAAGVFAGAAGAIKFPAALVGGGPALRMLLGRRLTSLAALAGAAAGTAGLAYALAGGHAFDQVRRAANSVSLATPWHLLDAAMGVNQHRVVIRIGSLVLLAALVWLLARALPRDPRQDPDVAEALAVSAALVLAWLWSATYALPWYDGLGWAVLALLPWSRLDWALLGHTAALSLAYLPARDPALIGLPDDLMWLVTVLRSDVIPWLLTGLLIWAAATALRSARPRPVPAPARSPRGSAGSPG